MSRRWNSVGKTAAAGTTVAFATPAAKDGISVIDSLVVESGNTAHTITCLRAYDRTVTTAVSNSSTNTVTVSNATIGTGYVPGALAANDWVCVRQSDGSILTTTVNAVNTTTKVVTLNANTTASVNIGADVWMYGTAANVGRNHLVAVSTANTSVEVFPLGAFFADNGADSPIIVHNANATNASTHWCSGRIVPGKNVISATGGTASANTVMTYGLGGKYDKAMDVTGLMYTVAGTEHIIHYMTPLATMVTTTAIAAAGTDIITTAEIGAAAGLNAAAAGDFIGVELNDHSVYVDVLASVSGSGPYTYVLTNAIPTGNSVRAGAHVWYFGLTTDSHVNWETGTSNTTNLASASRIRLPQNTPLMIHSNNDTAAGRVGVLSAKLVK